MGTDVSGKHKMRSPWFRRPESPGSIVGVPISAAAQQLHGAERCVWSCRGRDRPGCGCRKPLWPRPVCSVPSSGHPLEMEGLGGSFTPPPAPPLQGSTQPQSQPGRVPSTVASAQGHPVTSTLVRCLLAVLGKLWAREEAVVFVLCSSGSVVPIRPDSLEEARSGSPGAHPMLLNFTVG